MIDFKSFRLKLWLENVPIPRPQLHLYLKARWSGRVRKGVGLSTGETTEQTNSYMSRCGLITRHMTASGTYIIFETYTF